MDPLTSESEEEDGGIVFRRHSNPSNWATREKAETVNGGSHSERDIPAEIDCRHVLRTHGFSADLIERAIRELGECAQFSGYLIDAPSVSKVFNYQSKRNSLVLVRTLSWKSAPLTAPGLMMKTIWIVHC